MNSPSTPNDQAGTRRWEADVKELLNADKPWEALTLLDGLDLKEPRDLLMSDVHRARAEAKLGEFDTAEVRINQTLRSVESPDVDRTVALEVEVEARFVKGDILMQSRSLDIQVRFYDETLARPIFSVRDRSRLLADSAWIKRRLGHLAESSAQFAEAFELWMKHDSDPVPVYYHTNFAITLIHQGKYVEAGHRLSMFEEVAKIQKLPPHWLSSFALTSASLALHTGSVGKCQAALAYADRVMGADSFRHRVVYLERTAELRLLQGKYEEARKLLETLMLQVEEKAKHSDLVPEVSRRLASVYLAMNKPNEALSSAMIAASAGADTDVLEQIAGTRLACESCVDIGDLEAAETWLQKVQTQLPQIEFKSELDAITEAEEKVKWLGRIRARERRESGEVRGQERLNRQLQEIGKEFEKIRMS